MAGFEPYQFEPLAPIAEEIDPDLEMNWTSDEEENSPDNSPAVDLG